MEMRSKGRVFYSETKYPPYEWKEVKPEDPAAIIWMVIVGIVYSGIGVLVGKYLL